MFSQKQVLLFSLITFIIILLHGKYLYNFSVMITLVDSNWWRFLFLTEHKQHLRFIEDF